MRWQGLKEEQRAASEPWHALVSLLISEIQHLHFQALGSALPTSRLLLSFLPSPLPSWVRADPDL